MYRQFQPCFRHRRKTFQTVFNRKYLKAFYLPQLFEYKQSAWKIVENIGKMKKKLELIIQGN